MKIACWNVNSLKVRLPHVLAWLEAQRPDVLALQETKLIDENFPAADFESAGYRVVFAGQKTYNGVAIASREPISDVICDIPDLDDPSRRILGATIAGVRVLDLYVVNGQAVGTDKYEHKLHWLERVTTHVAAEMAVHEQLIVLGDFNIAPDDRDVHDPAAWHEKILCSTRERRALDAMLGLGLADTFRLFDQEPGQFSWWDYRAAGFRRNLGLRIDLILASRALAARCIRCWIDTAPRRLERPSDHAPVMAEFTT